ncbi:hypothetical protein BJY01DRAFT_250019 [Aspergillus pseudoustus]|uniref:Integral membrane protein n=1 Tax=Aspergillus pseudoustus TaxID=1810923 RepID=A0ABR4JK31_9EURO
MSSSPFVAEEVLCTFPISTLYESCPRYLFYALLLATCVARRTGWLADVFLGAAATYAGTAALEAFILVTNPAPQYPSSIVSIPFLSSNSTTTKDLRDAFPALVSDTSELSIRPAAIDLDADAVLAIVVTVYLIFLPLQCWSRAFTQNRARYILFSLWHVLMLAGTISALVYWPHLRNTPIQYAFCKLELPALSEVTSDGWKSWERSSPSWNASIWTIFTNETLYTALPDICYYPCFNTTQVLRQQTALTATIPTGNEQSNSRSAFLTKVFYSTGYIYSLIVVTLIVNLLLLVYKFLPYHSHIPSSQIRTIWLKRMDIVRGFRADWYAAAHFAAKSSISGGSAATTGSNIDASSVLAKTRTQLTRPRRLWAVLFFLHIVGAWLRLLLDLCILFAVVFSVVVSPLTVVAFVVWIEYYIHTDGPAQETPKQVGQWAPLASIGFLVLSAGILKLKEWVAPKEEIEYEIAILQAKIENLQRMIV